MNPFHSAVSFLLLDVGNTDYCAPSLPRMVIRDTNCGNIDGGALLERNVIAQSINTGHDVANIQFDLQMGNGGTGAFNNCAGQSWSMFPGPFDEAIWGAQYGGCSYREVYVAVADFDKKALLQTTISCYRDT